MSIEGRTFPFFKKFIAGEAHFAFWNVATKGFGALNAFITLTALSVYEYGVLQLFLATYAIGADLTGLGAGPVIIDLQRLVGANKMARAKRLFWEYIRIRSLIGIVFWAIGFFGAPIVAFKYGPDFISLIRIMSFLFLAETGLTTIRVLVALDLNFKAIASRSSIGKAVQLGILGGFVLFASVGIREVLISMIGGLVISTLLLVPATLRAYRPWKKIEAQKEHILSKLFMQHGKWDILRRLGTRMTSRIQPWLVKLFINTEAVAIYSVAAMVASAFKTFIPTNTLSTLVPRKIGENSEQTREMFAFGIKYIAIFGMVVMVFGWTVVPPVIKLFFSQYSLSLPFFFFLMLEVPIQSVLRIVDNFLVSLRRQKFFFARSIASNMLSVTLMLVLLPLIKLWGLAVADVVVPLVVTVVSFWYLKRTAPEFKTNISTFFTFKDRDRQIIGNIFREGKRMIRSKFS